VTPAKPNIDTSTDLLTYRYRRNLTLVQLSVMTGLSASTLHRLERGLLKPTPRSQVRLMDGLQVSADEIDRMLRQSAEKYGPANRVVTPRRRSAKS